MREKKTEKLWIALGAEIPSLDDAWQFTQDPSSGATSLFTGTTRNHHDGKKVTDLFYDSYDDMAVHMLEKLGHQKLESNSVQRVAIFHKTGEAPIGTISLIVAVSAPHRKTAMDVTAELIDDLKQLVPIWKHETFEGKDPVWREELLIRNSE